MLIAYWIVAGLAALAFLGSGLFKLVRPAPALRTAGMTFVDDFPGPAVKLIGLAEVLGALGLVLPMLTGVAPVLSVVAAICLGVLMVGAVGQHLRRHEPPVPPLVLLALTVAAAVLGALLLRR